MKNPTTLKKKKKKQLWKKGTCLNKLKKIVFFFHEKNLRVNTKKLNYYFL